ncbi:MAG TPA: iron chelate uptake ABC transporter family permease subunit, partial [Nocardioides sp.]|nr:iron chelate uptake ABC transporter family permease subunit [Nocardioides sp.]
MATLHATPLRLGGLSWLVPVRAALVSLVGAGVLFFLVAIDLAVGDFPIPVGDVVRTLFGGGDEGQRFVVMELRLPQTAVAVTVGASLGLAGALTQTLARNPLASPDILGVTDGAAFGAVLVIVVAGGSGYGGGLVSGQLQEIGLPIAAFIGALGTALLLYLLSWRRGLDMQRLVLVGIGLGATLTAATAYLLVNARIQDAASAQVWLSGSLSARGWEHGRPVLITLAVLVPLSLLLIRSLNAMLLGDDAARGLGVRLQLTQLGVLIAAVGLTSVAVAAVGPLEFVALVVPQVALR